MRSERQRRWIVSAQVSAQGCGRRERFAAVEAQDQRMTPTVEEQSLREDDGDQLFQAMEPWCRFTYECPANDSDNGLARASQQVHSAPQTLWEGRHHPLTSCQYEVTESGERAARVVVPIDGIEVSSILRIARSPLHM